MISQAANGTSGSRIGNSALQAPLNDLGNEELIHSIKNPNTFNYRLHWKFSRGEFEACETMLSKWKLQSCKNYEYGHFLQSKLHRKKGNLSESIKSVKLCYMIDPNNLNYVKETAKTFCVMGKHKTALNLILNCQQNAIDWELQEQLGDIYMFFNTFDKAQEAYLNALRLNNNKGLVLKLGKLYMKLNQTESTQRLFGDYAQQNLLDSQILEELGFIFLALNQKPEALHYMGQAIIQNPQNQDLLLSLGSLAQEFGDNEGAIQRYREFYAENQNSPEMWSNLGNCYLEREIYLSALSCFKRALFLSPMDWGVYYNIGLVYLTMKVYGTAFHYFLTSVKYNPQHADGYTYLGVCLNKLGEPASAFNAFEKATQIDPNSHQTFLNFAIFLAENAQDASNIDLAKEKFLKHDELYRNKVGPKDFQTEQQRMILKNFLALPG